MSRRSWAQLAVQTVVVVAAAFGGGLIAVTLTDDGGAPLASPALDAPVAQLPVSVVSPAAPQVTVAPPAGDILTLPLADVVEDVRRSVVSITINFPGQNRTPEGGTGIVVDREGHILTNHHVVESAEGNESAEIVVELSDGSVARAQFVSADPGNDLAVIRISVEPGLLVPARFGDSGAVRVGESVFAIGTPFSSEFKFTVTRGIVSGLGRTSSSNTAGRAIRDVIQIDAAVNPGNSGGPLFNARGEVIGINTAILNPTQQRVFIGIGLAIPSNTAVRYLPALIAGDEIVRAQLGVSGRTLNALNADEYDVQVDRGVYIVSVSPGSGADRAGLRPDDCNCFGGVLQGGGDVVVAIDGVTVTTMQRLAIIVERHDVGDEVTLTVVRDGEQLELRATLQEWRN